MQNFPVSERFCKVFRFSWKTTDMTDLQEWSWLGSLRYGSQFATRRAGPATRRTMDVQPSQERVSTTDERVGGYPPPAPLPGPSVTERRRGPPAGRRAPETDLTRSCHTINARYRNTSGEGHRAPNLSLPSLMPLRLILGGKEAHIIFGNRREQW